MVIPYFKNIRAQLLKELDLAQKDILVAIYWFTSHQLFDKLCKKQEEGVKVSLIIHNDFINNRETGLNFQRIIDLGGELYFSDNDNPMHNKFCVIDDLVLINGSYNWTYFAESKNNENILIIKNDNQAIKAFQNEFSELISKLTRVEKVSKLTEFEIDEFSGLSSREYLASDLIYEAKETSQPEKIQDAFKISPENIKIQKEAIKLDLTAKRKLRCSIGASIKDNKYLIGIEKGSILPISIVKILHTIKDNQASCSSTIYYGDKELADHNKKMPKQGRNGKSGGVKLEGLPILPAGEARMKMIFTIDIYAILKVKFYSLDNGIADYFTIDVKNLVAEVI